MQLPDTDNATYIFAFKKGYRSAMEGRSLTQIPSQIKLDSVLRGYFHQGWNQYHDDLAEAEESDQESPWKNKAIWMVMAILAGLSTASIMIDNIRKEHQSTATQTTAEQPTTKMKPQPLENFSNPEALRLISNRPETGPSRTSPQPNHQKTVTSDSLSNNDNSLGLLSSTERLDLKSTISQYPTQSPVTSNKLVPSTIIVERAVLTDKLVQNHPGHQFTNYLPKYVRNAYFYTQIKKAKGKTLYHQWRYNGKIMATIPIVIKTDNYAIWSSKQLSSAWSGAWQIEILNTHKHPIYRLAFEYGR